MIGIVIATHGTLAAGFENALNLIMGQIENSKFLGLNEGNNIDDFGQAIYQSVVQLDEGQGVLVFTDLQGATPFNQAVSKLRSLKPTQFEIITGVNLPMLVEAINERLLGKDLQFIKNAAMKVGQTGINDLTTLLDQKS